MIFEGKKIQCKKIENDIAELTFDAKDGSVNKFDTMTLNELREVVNKIKTDSGIKGLLISSAKSVFIVGADIMEFKSHFKRPDSELEEWLRETNNTFSDIEDLNVPSVTAINGMALGGGFEVTLSTAFRVASKTASVGLPETKLGIYPGWGGTVRLSRLVGADNAIEWIAAGKPYNAEVALKTGAVDAVVAPEKLKEACIDLLKQAIDGKIDWKSRQDEKRKPIKLNDIESIMVFEGAKGFIANMTGPNYPAPIAAISAMQKGASLDRNAALDIEGRGFVKMAKTPVAESLVSIFLGDQYLKKIAKNYQKQTKPVKQSAVLGAGIMGGGIAYHSASKGVPIIMKDIQPQAIELGLGEATKLCNKLVLLGKMDATGMGAVLNSIIPTLSYGDFKNIDIVVEAVIENLKIKKSVLAELEGVVRDDCVITSNTSTLSITDLADGLKRPELFCGMHFFNPVHKMPLVEVIRGKKTSEAAIAKTVSYAVSMGKTPIVVNDCAGFLVNRILFPYFNGFLLLLNDGGDFKKIDKVMEKFGWPMGPAYLLDVVGVDTAHHCVDVMAKAYPDRMRVDSKTALDALFENNRYGQKNGKGFFQYVTDRKGKPKKNLDTETYGLLKSVVHTDGKDFSDEEVIDRIMIPMIIESVRCLEDEIVPSPIEVDMGLIYGLGFPPFRGGIFKYVDSVGIKTICEKAKKYMHLGKCYEPTAKMLEMAKNNEKFHRI